MQRPLPVPTPETLPFWEGLAAGQLRYQACASCGTVQLLPRGVCAACHADTLEWRRSTGRGRILSHTTVHRAPTPAFRDAVPYVILLVDMDEGFRLMVNLSGGEQPGLEIGAPVDIGFIAVDACVLPEARLRS
jgi:uncharacterized OB-fold protein